MSSSRLIGTVAAGALLKISPQLANYWAATRRLRCVSRSPYRFRVEDVLALAHTGAAPRTGLRLGRPPGKQLNRIMEDVLS